MIANRAEYNGINIIDDCPQIRQIQLSEYTVNSIRDDILNIIVAVVFGIVNKSL